MTELINKLRELLKKKSPKEWMIILVVVGLLFVIMIWPFDKEEKKFIADVSVDSYEGDVTLEKRLENILEQIEGVGNVSVMITYDQNKTSLYENKDGSVEGIVVVCESANEGEIVLCIHDVIQALFPIESHKIRIVKGITSNNSDLKE